MCGQYMRSCNSFLKHPEKKKQLVFSCKKKGMKVFMKDKQITLQFIVFTSIQISAVTSQSIDSFTVLSVSALVLGAMRSLVLKKCLQA